MIAYIIIPVLLFGWVLICRDILKEKGNTGDELDTSVLHDNHFD